MSTSIDEIKKRVQNRELRSVVDDDISVTIDKIKKRVQILTKNRDELRSVVEDAEDILSSLDEGIDGFEDALRALQDALDKVSEMI